MPTLILTTPTNPGQASWTDSTLVPTIPTGPAGGDLDGTYPNPTVDGLQGRALSAAAPGMGDGLVWNAGLNQWEPGVVAGPPGPPGPVMTAVYGSFSDTQDQPVASGGTTVVQYDTVEAANGVSVVNDPITLRPTRLTISTNGVYSFSLSPQLQHTGGGTVTIIFWARINGLNVPRSSSSLEMGNNNNRTIPFIEIITPMTAGQYFEWVFTSSGTNTSLEHFPAVVGPPAIPAIPSVIAGVKLIGS
jgi:hypothetical protein